MNLTRTRKYYHFLRKTDGIFLRNPILALGLALPLAVIPSYGIAGTTAISLAMLLCFVPIVFIASILGDKVPTYLRVILYPLLSCLLLIPASVVVKKISPVIFDTLGVYFSLICVNSLMTYSVEKAHVKKPGAALGFALRQWIGATLVCFVCGFIRKLLATGSVFGLNLFKGFPSLSVTQMAFGGFILLGFFAALCRVVHRSILYFTMKAGENSAHEEQEKGGTR